MNYSTTNSSGTSSVVPGVGHFLLFPAPHGGGFVAFCELLHLYPGVGWVRVYFDWCIRYVIVTNKTNNIHLHSIKRDIYMY